MERLCLYLKLPPYLAEWYANECREIAHRDSDTVSNEPYRPLTPVPVPRGSQESRILQCFLKKQPKTPAREPEDANLALIIPYFRDRDPLYYNYLGTHARQQLADAIRTRFQVQLWEELHTFPNALSRQDHSIYAFMEAHAIACTETNWNAIAKIYQRQRQAYYVSRSRKKSK